MYGILNIQGKLYKYCNFFFLFYSGIYTIFIFFIIYINVLISSHYILYLRGGLQLLKPLRFIPIFIYYILTNSVDKKLLYIMY